MKTTTIISKFSFLVGSLLLGGGLFVLLRCFRSFSTAEIRILIGVNLLIWGAYFFQVSDSRHLRSRLEALEKRMPKSDSNS